MQRKLEYSGNHQERRSRQRLRTPSPPRISPRRRNSHSESRSSRKSPPRQIRKFSPDGRRWSPPRRTSPRPRRRSPLGQSKRSPGKSRRSSPGPSERLSNKFEATKEKSSENVKFALEDLKKIKLQVENSVKIVRRPDEGTRPIFDREEIKNAAVKHDEEIESCSFLDRRIVNDRIHLRENGEERNRERERGRDREKERGRERDRGRERGGERERDRERERERSRSRSRSRSRGRRSPRNHTHSPVRERQRLDRRFSSADGRIRERSSRDRSPRREREPYEVGPPIAGPPIVGPRFVPAPVYLVPRFIPRPMRPPMVPPYPRGYIVRGPPVYVRPPPPHPHHLRPRY